VIIVTALLPEWREFGNGCLALGGLAPEVRTCICSRLCGAPIFSREPPRMSNPLATSATSATSATAGEELCVEREPHAPRRAAQGRQEFHAARQRHAAAVASGRAAALAGGQQARVWHAPRARPRARPQSTSRSAPRSAPDPFAVLSHTTQRGHTVCNEAVASNAVAHRDGPAVYQHRESENLHALALGFPGERGVVGIRLW